MTIRPILAYNCEGCCSSPHLTQITVLELLMSITQSELKSFLHYDENSGDFFWKVNKKRARAGDIAGMIRNGQDAYRLIQINGVQYRAHRLVWLYIHGEFPNGEIDHINQNKSDNRISNLRIVTSLENHRNRKKPIDNTSGCVGVNWHKGNKAWQAKITIKGKTLFLGLYTDITDAIRARKKAETKYGFHINHGS